MRIFYSTDSDPMILDSVSNLNAIYSRLNAFATNDVVTINLKAIIVGSPEPYSEYLPYIQFKKSEGKILIELGKDKGLLISGSIDNLTKYFKAFEFDENEDGGHHHPDCSLMNNNNPKTGKLWPLIEADNDYVAEHQWAAS